METMRTVRDDRGLIKSFTDERGVVLREVVRDDEGRLTAIVDHTRPVTREIVRDDAGRISGVIDNARSVEDVVREAVEDALTAYTCVSAS